MYIYEKCFHSFWWKTWSGCHSFIFPCNWIMKLMHLYLMTCPCFFWDLPLSQRPVAAVLQYKSSFFWCSSYVGLEKCPPRRCHSVALRNAWNPFKEHVKQQLGGSQQWCQKLHGWWQHTGVVCINGASLTNIYIWQVNSEGDSVCVNVTDQLWTMILLLFLLKSSD